MKKRNVLTIEEFNAVTKLTEKLKVSFDIYHNDNKNIDKFVDYENDKKQFCLTTGFTWLYDAIAYPLRHERLNENEINIIVGLFKEFCNINQEFEDFLRDEQN